MVVNRQSAEVDVRLAVIANVAAVRHRRPDEPFPVGALQRK
jgi:hypothetical protein